MGQYGELREMLLHRETEEADHRKRGKQKGKREKEETYIQRHKQGTELNDSSKKLIAAIAVRIIGLSNVSQ